MNYTFFVTDDNSPSLRNLEVDEPYHSKAGAYLEAREKYVLALNISSKKNPVIFDVCFGLGYNTAAAIDELLKKKSSATFICFENDLLILKELIKLEYDSVGFKIMQQAVKQFLEGQKNIVIQNFNFIFELGDAKNLIKKYDSFADFVFFDPFSPKKAPGMWQESFLQDVYDAMKKNSGLATYSYARMVRENLKSAGFTLLDGPIVGRRSPSTIAIKKTL